MADEGKLIVTIGFVDSVTLAAKHAIGRGDRFENVSEAVTDAVTSQCDLGDEFYFSFDLNQAWIYDASEGSLFIEKVDSSPPLRIGLQSRKGMRAWIPRYREAMDTLSEARRFPDLLKALPDETAGNAE
ncbi:hypothetical protein [Methylorubrum aminovorans]